MNSIQIEIDGEGDNTTKKNIETDTNIDYIDHDRKIESKAFGAPFSGHVSPREQVIQ